MSSETTDRWRCISGHGLFERHQLAVRRGQLQCGACMVRGLVDQLVPATHVRCVRCTFWAAVSPCNVCKIDMECEAA